MKVPHSCSTTRNRTSQSTLTHYVDFYPTQDASGTICEGIFNSLGALPLQHYPKRNLPKHLKPSKRFLPYPWHISINSWKALPSCTTLFLSRSAQFQDSLALRIFLAWAINILICWAAVFNWSTRSGFHLTGSTRRGSPFNGPSKRRPDESASRSADQPINRSPDQLQTELQLNFGHSHGQRAKCLMVNGTAATAYANLVKAIAAN